MKTYLYAVCPHCEHPNVHVHNGYIVHHTMSLGGYAAMIGLIDGQPMILHKLPDGRRELEPAALP